MLQVLATTPRAHLPPKDLPRAPTTSIALLRHPLTSSDSLRIGTSTTHRPRVHTALSDPSRVNTNAVIISIQRGPTTLSTTNPLLTSVAPLDLDPLNGSQGATMLIATVLPVLHPTSLPPVPSATRLRILQTVHRTDACPPYRNLSPPDLALQVCSVRFSHPNVENEHTFQPHLFFSEISAPSFFDTAPSNTPFPNCTIPNIPPNPPYPP